MGITNQRTVYPFAEMVEVTSESTTAVDVLTIPAGAIIENVLVRVTKVAVAGGAINLTVGDDDDGAGFILAADAKAAIGTVYGEATTARGLYLYDATAKGGHVKLYAAAGKEVKLVLSGAVTTQGAYQVIILGKRFAV